MMIKNRNGVMSFILVFFAVQSATLHCSIQTSGSIHRFNPSANSTIVVIRHAHIEYGLHTYIVQDPSPGN